MDFSQIPVAIVGMLFSLGFLFIIKPAEPIQLPMVECRLSLVPLQATLILFFSKAEAGWWGGSDLLQKRTQRRIKSHHPYLSVIFHTMFSEGH